MNLAAHFTTNAPLHRVVAAAGVALVLLAGRVGLVIKGFCPWQREAVVQRAKVA